MSMRKLRIGVLMTLLGLVYACEKKPLPEAENTAPDFYLDATVNGEHLYFGAGENDYYMNSSHFLDTNHVFVLKADLSQTTCTASCGYALSILINDKKTSLASEPFDIDRALHTGNYIYNDQSLPPLYYQAFLKPLHSQSTSEIYRWQLNGVEIQSYTASAIVESGSKFSPALYFEDAEGLCSANLIKQYRIGNVLQSEIEVQKEGPTDVLMYSFSANPSGKAPFRYTWDFGDGTTESSSTQPFHTYTSQGFYNVKLTLTDALQDTCINFYQIPAFIDPRCEANFTSVFTPLPNTKGYSAITVLLKHPDGRVFSSKPLSQSGLSAFEITEVSDYKMNNNNEPTKKIKIRFNCSVQNGMDQIKIENAEAVLAVSYE